MIFKAFPRVWVDISIWEVVQALTCLLAPRWSCGHTIVPRFEQEFATFIDTSEAVAFTNCRSSLYFTLQALDLKPGDEVILPAFTFWVDAAVVVLAGLKPVFVDVCIDTLNIEATKIETAITGKTRAILLAHLNGLPADMAPIMDIARRHKLRVIEDCARSCGARYQGKRVGSFDIGAFSFGYGKSLYGFGGGMVTSDDHDFIARLRKLRHDFRSITIGELYHRTLKGCLLKFLNTPRLHWCTLLPIIKRYQFHGDRRFASWFEIKKPHYNGMVPEDYNIHMYNIQARMGLQQLRTIESSNRVRLRHLKTLNQELQEIAGLHLPPDPSDREHVNVHYAVWTEEKEKLQAYLLACNIDAQNESAQDVSKMKRFRDYAPKEYPNAARLDGRIIYLPAHPCLTTEDMKTMAGKVKSFFSNRG